VLKVDYNGQGGISVHKILSLDDEKQGFMGREYYPDVIQTNPAVIKSAFSGLARKGAKPDFNYGYNVIAYFKDFHKKGAKHYLPPAIVTELNAHKDEFFSKSK
jgi:hypothetical protein